MTPNAAPWFPDGSPHPRVRITMKKLRIEDLTVESFTPAPATPSRGTVMGHGTLFDWTCSTCGGSCNYTCAPHCTAAPENTCYYACLSMDPRCEPSQIWDPNGKTCITEPY
jgi:hypothetical protein